MEYVVKISKDGSSVEIDTQGGVGQSCKTTVADMLKKLGVVDEEKKKPEYYQTEGCGVGVGKKC